MHSGSYTGNGIMIGKAGIVGFRSCADERVLVGSELVYYNVQSQHGTQL